MGLILLKSDILVWLTPHYSTPPGLNVVLRDLDLYKIKKVKMAKVLQLGIDQLCK